MRQPRDLRVLVTHGVARVGCWRIAAPGEFRSNVHLGATTQRASLNLEMKRLAEAAAAAVGLTHVGVDLLPVVTPNQRDPDQPGSLLVLEVNGSPGLEGIERVTQRDLASLVIDDALQAYARGDAGAGIAATSSA
jgi:ribosomal protein S6--L-glutamate ligase